MLEFSQINLHHCKEAAAVLSCSLTSGQTSISLIQEPYFFQGRVRGLGNAGTVHCVNSGNNTVRACVYTAKCINALLLRQFSTSDLVAVQIRYKKGGENRLLVVCSVYLPYEGTVPTRELAQVVDHCKNKNIDLLIGCDTNAHHVSWGSSDCNPRGFKLLEFLVSSDLCVINRGARPTFFNRRSSTVIDLTICSPSLEKYVQNWIVSQEDTMSDHMKIKFSLSSDRPQITPFRNPRKTDWLSYKEKLERKLGEWSVRVNNVLEIEESVAKLTKSIIEAFEESCPLRKPKFETKPIWFTHELRLLKKECNTAWNARNSDYVAFRDKRQAFKKACRYAKRRAWREFCETVEGASASSRMHKILSKDRSDQVSSLKLPNGEFTQNESELLDHLLLSHFPGSIDVDVNEVPVLTDDSWVSDDVRSLGRHICDAATVRWAVNSFSPYKSPGPDGILPVLLQKGLDQLEFALVNILQACLVHGHVPTAWREVRVTFIPKPGKADYENVKSYRGISLSSFLLKTLERLVDRYLRCEVLPNHPLHSWQHAYQRGKSTMTAMHSIVSFIEETLHNKEHALAVFLDVEGAFDRATFTSFRNAAVKHGIDPFITEWILNMLSSRTLIADINGIRVRKRPVMGCPQGGVLSALIWLLIADDLVRMLAQEKVYTVAFADDFTLLIRGFDISTVYSRMRSALKIVERYTSMVGLSVNPAKAGSMFFSRTREVPTRTLPLLGKDIPLMHTFKVLGVLLDDKLNWGAHIKEKTLKACTTFGQCRRAVGKKWGLRPSSIHWIYTAVVRPSLSYGALVWWQKAQQTTVAANFSHIQRLCLLAMSGAMSTTPTAALEALFAMPPLHLYVKACARAELFRLHTWGELKSQGQYVRTGHASLWLEMTANKPLLLAPSDCMIPIIHTLRNFSVSFPSRELWLEDESLCNSDHTFYTDGSLLEGMAGCGVFSENPRTELSRCLGPNASVFQAEISGLIDCITVCLQHNLRNKEIKICCDSRAALSAVSACKVESRLVLDCINALNLLGASNDLGLLWIPSHSSYEGNEAADELARAGSAAALIGPLPVIPLSKGWVKSLITDWLANEHKRHWLTPADSYRQTRNIISEPLSRNDAKRLISLSKPVLRKLVGFATGHSYFRRHLKTIGLAQNSQCERCLEDEETAYHLLCDCPALSQRRRRYMGDSFLNEDSLLRAGIWKIKSFISGINLCQPDPLNQVVG